MPYRWLIPLILVCAIVGAFCAYQFHANHCDEIVNIVGDPGPHFTLCRRLATGLVSAPTLLAILTAGSFVYRFFCNAKAEE
jgi:hypothetical protein